ncbi:MAG: hypothetical protein EHM61_15575, partial [Acidobacteria bacterium]
MTKQYSLASILIFLFSTALADPVPGEYFREYTYLERFGEVDPNSTREGQAAEMRARAMRERALEIASIARATRAEVSVSYWGGHIGTSGQRFRINGGDWIDIPQPKNTPNAPQCYYRTILGRATVEVPLADLKAGRNLFQFTAGPQICYSFNWGFFWVYEFTVRLYYSPPAEPPGQMVSPAEGAVIGEKPRVTARAWRSATPISHVDFVAEYEDFNWEGDGVFRQWHYVIQRGRLAHHLGTATNEPYEVTWDTSWVPDQEQPVRIAARITDADGLIYMTPPVGVRLERKGRSVRLWNASEIPQAFGVRVGNRKECRINIDEDISGAREARLVLSTWSAAHAEEIGLNGHKLVDRVGLVHNYSFDSIPVPVGLLRQGPNTFYIFSSTKEHAAEVNWPGPALLIEYGSPNLTGQSTGVARVPAVELPLFWKSGLRDVEAEVKAVSKGEAMVIARSPGGLPLHAISYGKKEDFRSQANYNSAVAAGNPAYYARKMRGTKPVVVFLGPVHGQEVENIVGLVNLIHIAETGKDYLGRDQSGLLAKLEAARVVIVPIANPDGRRRCPYESFVGVSLDEMTKYGQG